jgi:hypothetical protein
LLRAWDGRLEDINGQAYRYIKGENVHNNLGVLAFVDPSLGPLLTNATKRCQTTLDITRDVDGQPITGVLLHGKKGKEAALVIPGLCSVFLILEPALTSSGLAATKRHFCWSVTDMQL